MLGPGVRLGGRYRLETRIGAGGMGEVWRGVDEVLGRTVAVKVMLPSVAGDPGFAQRFLAEATAMARVNHPSVASIHDYGTDNGVMFLVMEFVEGESLAGLLARAGRLTPADTMRVLAQAAEGLQAVHACGIVHRDIKPANLLIRRDGQVLVTDFGISRQHDSSHLTASGAILGTPSYLSPEQVLGQPVTALSDVYALGLTAYECLAGEKPFQGDNPYAVALQRLQSAPRTIGISLPPAVLAVIERALATDPARRWPSAAALAEAARSASGPNPVMPAPPVAAPAPARKRRALTAALLALVLVVAGVATWGFTRGDKTTPGAGPAAAASPAAGPAVPAGFAPCGIMFCPAEEMCWGGIVIISGVAQPPARVDCAEDHYTETFVAIRMPAAAEGLRAQNLIDLPDVKATCSAAVMKTRSHDPARTGSWTTDAWPIPTPVGGPVLLHCVAGKGETKGSEF